MAAGNAPSAKSTLTTNAGRGPQPGNKYHHANKQTASQGQFCQLCGAWYGSLGLEPTPEQHVENIVETCREVRRVLRDDGVFWLNYGDCYAGGGRGPSESLNKNNLHSHYAGPSQAVIAQGSLMMMPHRVALALQQDGWIIRQDLVWFKRNPMPESVNGTRWVKHRIKIGTNEGAGKQPTNAGSLTAQDGGKDVPEWESCLGCEECIPNDGLVLKRGSWRHTRAHEYVFMLTKKMGYWSNQEAVREQGSENIPWSVETSNRGKKQEELGHHEKGYLGQPASNSGRNPRSVLDVPTAPYKGAHYATFPPNLIAPLIRATCPRWACPVCGQGWAAVVDNSNLVRVREGSNTSGGSALEAAKGRHGDTSIFKTGDKRISRTLGYRPTCEHEHTQKEAVPGIVLDCFVGSGTTVAVAQQLLRHGVGLDISYQYLDEQAKLRTRTGTPSKALEGLPLFNLEENDGL